MTDVILFEHPCRTGVVRVQVQTFKGHTFASIRRWYAKDGEWHATREGVTIPLEQLSELESALAGWREANAPGGPLSAS